MNSDADRPPQLPRDARGKRPQFYAAAGLDEAMGMIMVIANELMVVRDRLDTIEQVSHARGIDLPAEIEAFVPGAPVLEAREARRQEFLERLFYLVRKDAAEQAARETPESFRETLETIAQG